MSTQSSLFDNVMTDMSGKIRLDGEDPRWIQLFSLRNVSKLLTTKEVAWYGNRLIENNIMTGNLVQLLDQTATRLQQISTRRAAPPGHLLDQCCSALFISALLLHHLAASLPATEFGRHLFMSDGSSDNHAVPGAASQTQHSQHNRPPQDLHHASSVRGGKVLERLVHELGAAIDSPCASTWMQDIKFFSVELLLCCCSTQLYASSAPSSGGSGAATSMQWHSSSSGPGDVVLNLLYGRAEQQLRAALGSVHSSSGAFSACLAVQLVRGLVTTACAAESGSAVAVVSSQRAQTAQKAATPTAFVPNTALLTELVAQYGVHRSDLERARREQEVGAGIGGTVQEILIDFLRYLPFGVLHRLFTAPPRPPLAGGADAAQEPAASVSLLTAEDDADSLDTTYHGGSQTDGEHTGAAAAAGAGSASTVAVLVQGAQLLPANPLAERSLDLLLVLLHNRRSPRCNKPNPFREAFGLLHDASLRDTGAGDDGGAGSGAEAEELDEEADFAGRGASMSSAALTASRINISFTALIQSLARGIPEESSALLLYSLLQSNTGFTDTLVRTGQLSSVLSACLRGLYELTAKPRKPTGASAAKDESLLSAGAEAKSLNQLYVLVVCALMLVQDSAVAAALCRGLQTSVPWYRERPMESVSLVDASFLCILRCIMHALCRAKDAYLLSNSCAILHNLTGALSGGGLLPYTAERIVRVTVQLCRRAQKGAPRAGDVDQQGAPQHIARDVNLSDAAGAGSVEWALLSEALGTMMQVLESTLRADRILNNVHLLYALMHEFVPLEAAFAHTAVAAALAEQEIPAAIPAAVVSVVRHYLKVVETAIGEANTSKYSAAQTVQIIAKEITKEREQGILYGANVASASVRGDADGSGVAGASQQLQAGATAAASERPLRKRYSYQEADNAEEFFVPAIWTYAIRSAPEIPWQMLRLTLVDPLAAGLVALRGPVLPPPHPSSQVAGYEQQRPGEEGEQLGAEQV